MDRAAHHVGEAEGADHAEQVAGGENPALHRGAAAAGTAAGALGLEQLRLPGGTARHFLAGWAPDQLSWRHCFYL